MNLLLFIHSFFPNKFNFLISCFNNLQAESEKNSQQFSQLLSSLKLTSTSKDISRLFLHFYLCLQFSTIHFQSEKCIFLSLSKIQSHIFLSDFYFKIFTFFLFYDLHWIEYCYVSFQLCYIRINGTADTEFARGCKQ